MHPLAPLEDKVSALAARFHTGGLPHAFGGEVALASQAPQAPAGSIDLHVFLPGTEAPAVLARLAVLGIDLRRQDAAHEIRRSRRVRWQWGPTQLALRFGCDGFHELARARVRRVPWAGRFICVLSAEDLLVEAALQPGRTDLEGLADRIAAAWPELDRAYVEDGLRRLGAEAPPPALLRLLALPEPGAPGVRA